MVPTVCDDGDWFFKDFPLCNTLVYAAVVSPEGKCAAYGIKGYV